MALKRDSSTARRRLAAAVGKGLLINLETRPRRLGRYKLATAPDGSDTEMLPTVEALREAFDATNGSVREEENIT